MSKKSQQRKAEARAREQARRFTPGKIVRLLLKSLAFALTVGLLVTLLTALGLPGIDRLWVQMLLVLGLYLAAYPFLMSEFRPRRPKGR